jgi:hypothetical protein
MITILTDPLLTGNQFLSESVRRIGRIPRDIFMPPKYNFGRYRGHYAVTRSLVEGLRKAELPFNYNPIRRRDLADKVLVLSGVRTLRQAIELKREGHYKKLYAGPNIVIFSSDNESLLASPEVDAAITPSQWVVDLYVEDNISLGTRCFAWPAGVDVDFWKPLTVASRKNILIFDKQNKGTVGQVAPYSLYLREKGYTVEIIKYGAFNHAYYLEALQRACLMIGFVAGESQGIAWAEAWATDVPTLIWHNERDTYKGRSYRCSTAPYLNPANGLFFNDMNDFKQQIARWEANPSQFSARDWTLSNMSDEVCARRLYHRITKC